MRNVVIAVLCVAEAATAKPPPLKAIDVKPVADKLEVYKDELGNYYVFPKGGAFASSDEAHKWVFFGDGKALYRQRIIGFSSQSDKRDWNVWAPRSRDMSSANLHVEVNDSYLQCKYKGDDAKRKLTQLSADEAQTLFKRTKLYPTLWQRRAHFLARDDDGVYYYVDALQEDYGGLGHRVFVGPKGAMKQMPMTNMASDSAGEIFATKGGQLKIITSKEGQAFWIKGGKKVELTVVPPTVNLYLIYRELGIYGPLGAPCDDQ